MPDRIELPLRVAMTIVLQGLRIRLGRSLVTISGVLLGIAILTSTATTYLVKDGVREEDQVRGDVQKMRNFLAAELGTLEGKSIAIYVADQPTEAERRLVSRLNSEAESIFLDVSRDEFKVDLPKVKQTGESRSADSDAALVIGGGKSGSAYLAELKAQEYTNPIGVTRLSRQGLSENETLYLVPLSTELTEKEAAALAREKITARYRVFWILAVALLVTLMGITNAMLMSVTERFREIGTMKCLGATSRLVRRIFIIESLIIGISGGTVGAILGALFSLLFYAVVYGPSLIASSVDFSILLLSLIGAVLAGVVLTVISAIYPASVASSMIPATALRSNV